MLSRRRLDALDRALAAGEGGVAAGGDAALPRGTRQAQGAYFTPAPLVELVVAETLAARLARDVCWRADGSPALVVLDPAAGDGRFLAAAADFLAARAAERGHDAAAARRAVVRRCLVGIERDPRFAAAAAAALGEGAVIHCAEALLDPPPELPPADAVVGNPPYLRSIRLAATDPALWSALRGRYAATSYREWDLYGAFIEQALAWCAGGGEVGLVVPSRWLTAAFAAPLRAKLAAVAAVRGIVDLGARQLFAGATTYPSLLFLSRAAVPDVAVARWRDGDWASGRVAAAELGRAPWRLAVGRSGALVERLVAAGPRLGDVARIVKGAGTNADPVYVVEPRGDGGGGLVLARSPALDDEVALEPALLRSCLRGRDVLAWDRASPAAAVVVPYHVDRVIPPAELRARYPRTAAYFERCRRLLEAREAGRFRGDTFYRFGRPQNLAFLADPAPKVVVPDVAREGRALLDGGGAFVLDSAYALRLAPGAPPAASLALLAAVLNSPVVALWLRETGVLLRGGYVRMKTDYLRGLPLPPPAAWPAIAAAVHGGAEPAAVAALVLQSYGAAALG